MDAFFEQLVSIKKTAKTWMLYIAISIVAITLIAISILILNSLAFIATVGIIYGAYKLYSMLSVEYEYILTNGTVDIDKIIAKSSRKRMLSFELSDVARLEKYSANAKPVGEFKSTIFACNESDQNAYFMVIDKEMGGKHLLVFSPNERMREGMVKFLPKFIANSAFKEQF